MANISKTGVVTATGSSKSDLVEAYDTEHGSTPLPSDGSRNEDTRSNMFELNDRCKIHKNGNIQSNEFIEI